MNIQSLFKISAVKYLRYLIAIVPIAWIFLSINWSHMAHAVSTIAWWTVPLLFCVIMLSMFLQGIRWWILMHAFDPSLSPLTALKAHFVGLYFSIILPSSAAQNVVRAMILSRDTNYSLSWGSSWVAGVIGLLAMAILSVFGLLRIDRATLPAGFFESIISSFAVLLVLFALSFSKRTTGPFRVLFSKFVPRRLFTMIENIRETVYKYRKAPGTVFIVFCITMFMQIIITVGACFVIFGISGKIILFGCLLYLPIIEILCISVPLTPNGIGIREGLLALMFLQVGLTREQLGIYIVLGFFSISLKLMGGIPLLFGPRLDIKRVKKEMKSSSEIQGDRESA